MFCNEDFFLNFYLGINQNITTMDCLYSCTCYYCDCSVIKSQAFTRWNEMFCSTYCVKEELKNREQKSERPQVSFQHQSSGGVC